MTNPYAVTRWTARFSDPATEAAYGAAMEAEDRRIYLVAGLLTIPGVAIKGATHVQVYRESAGDAIVVHGAVMAVLSMIVALVHFGLPRRGFELVGQFAIVLCAGAFVWFDTQTGAMEVQYAAVVGLIAAFLVWAPMSLPRAVAASTVAVGVHYAVLLGLRIELTQGFLPLMTQMIGVILLLTIPARHRQETDRRRRYAQREVISAKTRQYHELLVQVLPEAIAERLEAGEDDIADLFDEATVLFADLVDFSKWSKEQPPAAVLGLLRDLFGRFDALAGEHGLEKIKTIGDAYMVAGGVPAANPDHCASVASFALAMQDAVADLTALDGSPLQLRVGIQTGPLVAGITGRLRSIYDLWGDTVNTASRMESHGAPGRIQVTDTVREALGDAFTFEDRGTLEVKGRGAMRTWWLTGRR